MKIGVLGLQGDVAEHASALQSAGATPVVVKHPAELAEIDGLVVPGGESTTIGKLLDRFGLLDPLRERARAGMPLFGTCAGLILMATRIVGEQDAPQRLGLLDLAVRRNAYGRQVDSFETDIAVEGIDGDVRAVFIRAPVIESTGPDVDVLASLDGCPVLVRHGSLLGATFHPEISGDTRVHEMFVSLVESAA